jgi:replicative DNA helicase
MGADSFTDAVPTGIPELDHILGGGLRKGEMGVWIAYPKRGKSTLLVNHGAQAVRRGDFKVLHYVLEGSRKMVENRYDSVFAQEEYSRIKDGSLTTESWQRLQYEYQSYRQKLIIRGLTERWTYSVADLQEEMRELKQRYNWVPDALVVDYGDLLRARESHLHTEVEVQRSAFRDLKTLANRGYALWTASQAQRPKEDLETSTEILQSRKIADCYDKIRVADFLGTINQTQEERQSKQARLFAELYRDNAAGQVILVYADFARMTIASAGAFSGNLPIGAVAGVAPVVPLGYVKPLNPSQLRAPI